MTEEDKPLTIVFEDGWADNMEFDSPEEFNQFKQELVDKFTSMSSEELDAESRPLSDLSIEEQKEIEHIINSKETRH